MQYHDNSIRTTKNEGVNSRISKLEFYNFKMKFYICILVLQWPKKIYVDKKLTISNSKSSFNEGPK